MAYSNIDPMPTVLGGYRSIESVLLVSLILDNSTVIAFSDSNRTITHESVEYKGLGLMLGISATTSELKTSPGGITISISGIPDANLTQFLNTKIKGSRVVVKRGFYIVPTGGTYLQVVGRFYGIIDNYTIDEEYRNDTRTATNTIAIACSSVVQILENKVAGRKTNPTSFRSFSPTDASMDRVPNLVGANFDFGKPA